MGKPKFDPTKSFEVLDGQKPKFDPNASFDVVEEKPKPPGVSTLESALRGIGQGASLGFSDEITGGVEAGLNAIKNTSFDKNQILKDYLMSRDESRKSNETAKADNPSTYMAGDVGASIATAFVPGLNLAKGATLTARAAQAAAMGAASGLGMSNSDSGVELLKDTAIGGALGGAFQGVGEKVLPALGRRAGQFAKGTLNFIDEQVLPKVGWSAALVPEAATQMYLKTKGKIQAPEMKNILDDLTSLFSKAEKGVDDSQSNVLNRKEYGKGLQEKIKNAEHNVANEIQSKKLDLSNEMQQTKLDLSNEVKSRQYDVTNEIQSRKSDLRESKNLAKELMDEKFGLEKEALKNQSLNHNKDSVLDGLDELKKSISSESAKAYDILEKSNGRVSINPIKDLLRQEMKNLTVNGTPISDSSVTSHQNLSKLHDRLESLGKRISFPDAKKVMQQLDSDINISAQVGTYAPEADRIKANVRRSFDTVLKELSPDYRTQMAVVSKKAALLSTLSPSFGTESKVIEKLNNLTTAKGKEIFLPDLRRLSKEINRDVIPGADEYLKTQDVLSSPYSLDQFKKGLSHTQDFEKASAAYDDFVNPQKLDQFKTDLINSKPLLNAEKAANSSAAYDDFVNPQNLNNIKNQHGPDANRLNYLSNVEDISKAESVLAAAKENKQFLSPLSPNTVEGKVKATGGIRRYAADEFFSGLDEKLGTDYQDQIFKRLSLDSFKKGDVNGSRKVAVGSAIGKAAGRMMPGVSGAGGAGEAVGGAIGATAGFIGERYTGPLFKKLLDGRISSGEFMQNLAPKLGKFAEPLANAAKKGNSSVAATHFILQQTNPEYRKLTTEISDE